jgi:hypothetical protein
MHGNGKLSVPHNPKTWCKFFEGHDLLDFDAKSDKCELLAIIDPGSGIAFAIFRAHCITLKFQYQLKSP